MKINFKARHKARGFLLQALYQWQITKLSPREILLQFLTYEGMAKADSVYFERLFTEITDNIQSIDSQFEPYLKRAISAVSPVELAILRLSSYELIQAEIPCKVAINEAIELSKTYGAIDSHKFVNSILDHLAKKISKENHDNAS